MAKMAAMPIYGRNLKKSSIPEPLGLETWYVTSYIANHHFVTATLCLQMISTYPIQISQCSLTAQGNDQDLTVLLFKINLRFHHI